MAKVSLWSYVSKMPSKQFERLYQDFPQKIRGLLADWLENQPWEFINGMDTFSTEMANSLIQKLVEELERISTICTNDACLVLPLAEKLKSITPQMTMQIVELFKTILEGERTEVLKQFPRLRMTFCQKQEEMQFNFRIMMLQHKIKKATIVQQQLKLTKENMSFLKQMHDLPKLQMQWIMLVKDAFDVLLSAQKQAIKKLNTWKRQQQLAGNGAPFDENLLPLQERFEVLYSMYLEFDQMVKDFGLIGEQAPPDLLEQINRSIGDLVKSSLLVDKQPPQVLKTQTKFQASVNLLLGFRILNGITKMPVVKAYIITEKKAQELSQISPSESFNEGSGDIENGRSSLELTPATRTCGAVFKNMLLKKIKRCERKGSESVTEEKCAILFIVEINLNSSEMPFHLQALSLPIVVIVHGNQDNNAKATILWDNAFAEMERRPFHVEERVPWSKMCHTLNLKFVSEVGTKQELLPKHFLFLAQKIFNENNLTEEDLKDRTVSWTQFNKEPLRERNFTFWQWFDGVVDLTKKFLKNYWSDGLIMGFASKQYVQSLLGSEAEGTFLLRFSDSGIGGITIAYIVRGEDGCGQIQNIQPFTARDLQILSLGDRVKDVKELKILYKGRPKDKAFEKYFTKNKTANTSGYVPAKIKFEVEGGDGNQQISHQTMPGFGIEDMYRAPQSTFQSPSYSPSHGPMILSDIGLVPNSSPLADPYNQFAPPDLYSLLNPVPTCSQDISYLYQPQQPIYPVPETRISQQPLFPNSGPDSTDITSTDMEVSSYIDDFLAKEESIIDTLTNPAYNLNRNWDDVIPHPSNL
ncbi:signal transducer and activator of transcription 6 [Spea bombifrons]|uniref:signal transducer and activator of transcription 6 n=1 Tax=Spea bombifrons TaxID=233779 RepID=UPI0023492253|nr:signal transducer and activator of transcription 6 [Spea bombifrons]